MDIESIPELVRRHERNYINGNTIVSKYVTFDQWENNNKIDAALNSKFINGDTDSLNREKPYFNISVAIRNIWYRATNIALSKFRIKATIREHYVLAFVATMLIQEWMKKENFDGFLDKWGMTLAGYGSAVTKFVEKNGKLHCVDVPWNRIICDSVSFEDNPHIEVLEFTPAKLMEQGYDEEAVEGLLTSLSTRENLDGQKKDNKSDYIKVYEVHGKFTEAQYKQSKGQQPKEGDDKIFFQQIHIVSFVDSKKKYAQSSDFEDFTLYSGKETEDPNLITHLLEPDGRAQSVGAVEYVFDPQWMANHTAKQIKDTLDLASLVILQTSDGSLAGKNVLTSLITGQLLITAENQPVTQLNNQHDITQLQAYSAQWQALAKDITSTPDAVRGLTQPSGTAFRTVAVENKEGKSLFEVMKRTKKRYAEEMLRRYIIPFIKKQMDTTDEIAAILESQDITKLDMMYVPGEAIERANNQMKKTVLSGQIAQQIDPKSLHPAIQEELSMLGNQRFIKPSDIPDKTWKDLLKDFEWVADIDIEDKETDDQLTQQYLVDLFKTSVNPNVQAYMQTPQGKFLFNKILEKSNAASPLELAQMPNMPPPPTGQVVPQPNGGVSSAVPQAQTVAQ